MKIHLLARPQTGFRSRECSSLFATFFGIQKVDDVNYGTDVRYGGRNSTSAEEVLQIPVSRSRILVVGCEEGHPATINLIQLAHG